MSLILQIETATTVCSVSLAENGRTIALQEHNERNIHAEKITLFIRDVMQAADYSINHLDAVAVSKGPGSYTGLRIGVSAAKGLCFALDKPLIAINTLDAMASAIATQHKSLAANAVLCPMIDARRMEVYTAFYDGDGNSIRPVAADIIDENSYPEISPGTPLIIFGDGAAKCVEALSKNHDVVLLDSFLNSARQLDTLAHKKFISGEFEDVAYFEPYYLKEFIAGKRPTDT